MASVGMVATLLRELREARNLSLSEAARRADVSRTTLRDWESGAHAPPGPALERLLDAVRADPGLRAAMLAAATPQYAQIVLAHEPLGPPVGRGALLRAMRGRRGLTQGAVAQAMGVTQGAVAKWESGDSVPGEETLARLMAVLDASPQEAADVRRADETNESLTLEGAHARYLGLAANLSAELGAREPALLAHEAQVWRRAARDPRWEPALVEAMGLRANWLATYAGRWRDGIVLARQAWRLAQRCGAWKEGVAPFMLTVYDSPDGDFPSEKARARNLRRTVEFVGRLRDPAVRAFVEGSGFNLIAAEEQAPSGARETARRLEGDVLPTYTSYSVASSRTVLAWNRMHAYEWLGWFDEAAEIQATTPWDEHPGDPEINLALQLLQRMLNYQRHGVEPDDDEIRRLEACAPTLDAVPCYRHMVRDWHETHESRGRRRYV